MKRRRRTPTPDLEQAAGAGLMHRRAFIAGAAIAGAVAAEPARAEGLAVEPWMTAPGSPFTGYGQPSRFEAGVARVFANPPNAPGSGAARTPLHRLQGMVTPNGLHFERSHSGVPDIDPDKHRLLIHGLVARPLVFSLETLSRYPMESQIAFIECGGNSAQLYQTEALDADAQRLHGLVSCAEWTGVRLSTLLDEAGVDPTALWVLAEGGDAAGMSRSVPIAKAMGDALVALYQNGERIRPSNGYPMRLLLPGYEGNMQVKWLRRLKLVETPAMTRDETAKYTLLRPDGSALQFVFAMEVKSVITQPSPELSLKEPGLYEISGLAWSGAGRIVKVEVSADGGRSWAEAHLQQPILSKALTRFRLGWRWDGGPAVLQSRATDEEGNVQPTREALLARRGARALYHFNGIASWGVAASGRVTHVYA
ncbi:MULTISPECIES: sulfite dehydrogenase [Methylosinus]|uniref:Sulfite dehydrogenase n=1 Tax=Methylosinus trichosporium (strain ATCC 35070 / NCIMB 11131 / UNIQEM 75 / OB3b) TaxID=595536 RepID=A0A2D2D6N4_METT3|nr:MULTISPECIES: sulfite dehydrogenase [Methylosinus]ATQ70681.1 sulfite dehydrogenase [Methylosinus trichosporium OB3b]OBS52828.1 sulfite dehydrogenase [Methylosinus sp. 3S-1]